LYGASAITSYKMRLPSAAATGFLLGTNTAGDVVQTFVALNTGIIDSNNYASFAAACTAAVSATSNLLVGKAWTALTTQSCAAPITFTESGSLQPASGQTITLTGTVTAGSYQIFDISASGLFAVGPHTQEVLATWFGATGGGSVDDTAAIQAAINSRSTSGGTIRLLAGTYKTSAAITITTTGTILVGQEFPTITGNGFTIISSTSTTADVITVNGTGTNCNTGAIAWPTVRNLAVTRSVTASGSAKGIDIYDACWARVEDVESDDSVIGIYVYNAADTYLNNLQIGAMTGTGTKYGVVIDSSSSGANNSTWLNRVAVTGSGGATTGVYLHGDCIGDTFIDSLQSSGIAYGAQITSTYHGSSYCNGDVILTRPVLDGVLTAGIVVTNVYGTGIASVKISGAHIVSAAASVIGVDVENSSGVLVTNSEITNSGQAANKGIYVNGANSQNNVFSGNTIFGESTGIGLNSTANNVVSANAISADSAYTTGTAIAATSATYNTITGNSLQGTITNGITLDSGSTNNILFPNTCNITGTCLADSGTANVSLNANVGTWNTTPSGANLAAALTSALPNSKGGTGGDSSSSTGYAKVASGTWGYAAIPAADLPSTPSSIGATTHTMTAPREYFFCTTATACSVTLPVPAAGYEFCVRSDNNVSAAITLAGRTSIYYELPARTGWGTVSAALVSSGAAVDNQVCVIGYDATHYAIMSSKGF
jgi:hypothetical protein